MTSGKKSKAARKATIVKAWSEAADDPLLIEDRGPDGISAWRLGQGVCFIETLRDDAPAEVKLVYLQRVTANLTGRCPRCGAVASVERQRVLHERGCPVSEDVANEHLVNPGASRFLQGMKAAVREENR